MYWSFQEINIDTLIAVMQVYMYNYTSYNYHQFSLAGSMHWLWGDWVPWSHVNIHVDVDVHTCTFAIRLNHLLPCTIHCIYMCIYVHFYSPFTFTLLVENICNNASNFNFFKTVVGLLIMSRFCFIIPRACAAGVSNWFVCPSSLSLSLLLAHACAAGIK